MCYDTVRKYKTEILQNLSYYFPQHLRREFLEVEFGLDTYIFKM